MTRHDSRIVSIKLALANHAHGLDSGDQRPRIPFDRPKIVKSTVLPLSIFILLDETTVYAPQT